MDPTVLLGLAALTLGFLRLGRGSAEVIARGQWLAFGGTLLTLVVALISPLDDLADHALFTAHMLQHILLLYLVPVLALAALPAAAFSLVERTALMRRAIARIAAPLPAFLVSNAVLWAWHTPTIYEAALHSEPLHAFEHVSFLVTAAVYWWPVVRPATYGWPFPELFKIVYLFGGAASSTMLAALITFATPVLYPTYAASGVAASAHAAIGWSPATDQEVGGLLMWVVGGAWYLVAASVVFYRWFERSPDEASPISSAECASARLDAVSAIVPLPHPTSLGQRAEESPLPSAPTRDHGAAR